MRPAPCGCLPEQDLGCRSAAVLLQCHLLRQDGWLLLPMTQPFSRSHFPLPSLNFLARFSWRTISRGPQMCPAPASQREWVVWRAEAATPPTGLLSCTLQPSARTATISTLRTTVTNHLSNGQVIVRTMMKAIFLEIEVFCIQKGKN